MVTKRPPTPPVTRAVIVAAIVLNFAAWSGVTAVSRIAGPGSLSEPWRLLTSTLLHGGMVHLVFNLLWTWQLGGFIERSLGSARTALLYVGLALFSNLLGQLIEGPGIGLSGVVYGLFGTLWVAQRRGLPLGRFLDERITKFFVAWFFIAIAIDYFGFLDIGNAAHAAGALAGAAAGLLLAKDRRDRHDPRNPSSSQRGFSEQESRQPDEVRLSDQAHE